MEPEDWEVSQTCALCGAAIEGEAERCFAFGAENLLCWACATERGGRYDEARDIWERAPDLEGLRDEAYGSTPGEMRGRQRRGNR